MQKNPQTKLLEIIQVKKYMLHFCNISQTQFQHKKVLLTDGAELSWVSDNEGTSFLCGSARILQNAYRKL